MGNEPSKVAGQGDYQRDLIREIVDSEPPDAPINEETLRRQVLEYASPTYIPHPVRTGLPSRALPLPVVMRRTPTPEAAQAPQVTVTAPSPIPSPKPLRKSKGHEDLPNITEQQFKNRP